jgi:hypothetical protein
MREKTVGKPFKKNNPLTGEKDSRINRSGAPKKSDSWAQSLRIVGDMTGPEVARWGTSTAREFGRLPPGLTLKVLVCLNVYASLLHDFSASTWRELMSRTDGSLGDILESRLLALEAAQEKNNVNH